MPSPESPFQNPNSYENQIQRFCETINRALLVGAQLRRSPDDESLISELSRLTSFIIPESFSHHFPIRLVVPNGADAIVTKNYTDIVQEHPREFLSDHLSRIDAGQVDFQSLERPLEFLTSYDFDLKAEPYAT